MFKSKIQQKAKLTLFPILLIFAISLSLIFYFLSSKSKKPQYQPQKFEHQIGVATGSETKSNFPQSTSSEVKDIYAFVKNAIGDFYFENTKEIKAKEYGIPKLKACIYSDDCVIMAYQKFKYSQSQEIPNEILTFPKDLLLETIPKEDWRKKFEDFPYEEYKKLKEKLEKFSDEEYKEWLAQTIKNKSQSSPISIDYTTIKDLLGNKITVLRKLQTLSEDYGGFYSIDIFYYAPSSQRWRKLWGPTIYSMSTCDPEGMNLDYFLFNSKATIFTIEEVICGMKGLLDLPTLRMLNIGYVFYNENIVPVFYNPEDKYILLLSQLLPSYTFPKMEDFVEYENSYDEKQKNPFFEFPFIERIHKDKTYDYLLISHDSKLWLVVYNRVNKIIEERKFIKKLNSPIFSYMYTYAAYGDNILESKIPIITDIDNDGVNEILIPQENPWFYSNSASDKFKYYDELSVPVKIEILKFNPDQRIFESVSNKDICKLSNTYFEPINSEIIDKPLVLYRATIKYLKISPIEIPDEIRIEDLNTLMYNVCFKESYKFSFIFPHFEGKFGTVNYSIPSLLKFLKIDNLYIFLYYTSYGHYGGAASRIENAALYATVYDYEKNYVYTYLLDTISDVGPRCLFFNLNLSHISLEKNKIKLGLELFVRDRERETPHIAILDENKEYTIQLGKTSDQTPLISQFSGG
jgi:hypothetical protein